MSISKSLPHVAIACGGTGGHLFPGMAVADELITRGCHVTLMVSPKDVDQQAVREACGMDVVTLPAVGLTRGGKFNFLRGFVKSYRSARRHFGEHEPLAALAMGGFTSAPPILAARSLGACTFLHESNMVPGRANRWLSRVVSQAFVGFPQAADRLKTSQVAATGTPVHPRFRKGDAAACRRQLGLDPARPTVLVMGGSQGASGINELVLAALPALAKLAPQLQWIHLTGAQDFERVKVMHAGAPSEQHLARVYPFFAEMEIALGAATVAISRAGASSLAELAAMQVPWVLVPFPTATDNHQFHNARAFAQTGAARLLEQRNATPELLTEMILDLALRGPAGDAMRAALERWHAPRAAEQMADRMMDLMVAQDQPRKLSGERRPGAARREPSAHPA